MHKFKVYRVEWLTEIYWVDEYGTRTRQEPIYSKAHESYDDAVKDLERVSEPHRYVKDRRQPKPEFSNHSDYVDVAVSRREKLYSEF